MRGLPLRILGGTARAALRFLVVPAALTVVTAFLMGGLAENLRHHKAQKWTPEPDP